MTLSLLKQTVPMTIAGDVKCWKLNLSRTGANRAELLLIILAWF